ncbi:AAA family ATPase [Patescibacteria group bacterium]|nr:AAA family ATPase [Patescibacteria group bacterium]
MEVFDKYLFYNIILLILVGVYLLKSNQDKKYGQSNFFGKTKIFQPVIEKFTTNLTQLAIESKIDPVVGRDHEIKRLIQILSRRKKNNVILYGKAGIGKTAIVEGLAMAISQARVPQSLLGKTVLKLDISSVLAGTKYRGEFEDRFKALIDAIISLEKQVIVFIDEIHTIVQAGGVEGAIDADDIIKSPLARGDLQMVGTTTTKEFKEFILKDAALTRRFEAILVEEPSAEKTISMLKALRKDYEDYHNVIISDKIIENIVSYSAKIKNRVFPDKAIDIMDEVSAKARLDHVDNNKTITITNKDLSDVLKDFK